MINWDCWQTLLAVYRTGSFAQAAKSLNIDATTVGRRIKSLEKTLSYSLFIRNEGQLYPSNQCESLLSHIETASEALRWVEQESETTDKGIVWRKLRLAAPPFVIKNVITPSLLDFTQKQRLRIELISKISNASISKREVDIAISIDDTFSNKELKLEQIESEVIGEVCYAAYAKKGLDPDKLPWAGLHEGHIRTSGSKAMTKLAGKRGFQYRTNYFESLSEFATLGIARVMLPNIVADNNPELVAISDIVLRQPLIMLHHHQDKDVHHLKDAREWIKSII